MSPESHTPIPLRPGPLLIVDGDCSMQDRLRAILASLGYAAGAVHTANDVAAAQAVYAKQPIAMALVDLHVSDGTGIDLIRLWHQRDPMLPTLVISAWNTAAEIVSAFQAGAAGYMLKERHDTEIALAIRDAMRGGTPIDPFVARHILKICVVRSPHDTGASPSVAQGQLSRREIEILGLVSQGLTNKEIAGTLSLSNLTIECHTRNIYKKLSVRSRIQAVSKARAHGWLS